MYNPMINGFMMENTNDLDKSYPGYLKGNMFKNLYDPYKNYKPEIKTLHLYLKYFLYIYTSFYNKTYVN